MEETPITSGLLKKIRNNKERTNNMTEKVTATSGEVGMVYTTKAGMQEADPYENSSGWRQVSPTEREEVASEDIGGHQRWMVWKSSVTADATDKL